MPNRARCAALVAALLTSMGCARGRSHPTTQPDAAAGVYVAIVDSLWRRPGESVRIVDSTLAMVKAAVDLTANGVDASMPDLRQSLAGALRQRFDLRALLQDRGITLVQRATIDSIFRGRGPIAWPDYYAAYGRGGYAELSAVAFTPDSSHAALHVAYHCGGRCGYGSTITLSRDTAGQWRIQRIHRHWVS